jgi:hypothetical protein
MLAFRAAARPFASLIAGSIMSSGRPAALAIAVAALSLLGEPVQAQAAQANWWESLTGSGTPDYTGRRSEDRDRERAARQAEPLDDLRPDAMPMRSDEMIAAIEAAIAK